MIKLTDEVLDAEGHPLELSFAVPVRSTEHPTEFVCALVVSALKVVQIPGDTALGALHNATVFATNYVEGRRASALRGNKP